MTKPSKTASFIINITLELPTDEEGLTDEGWETVTALQSAIEALRDAGFKEIEHVGMPKRNWLLAHDEKYSN